MMPADMLFKGASEQDHKKGLELILQAIKEGVDINLQDYPRKKTALNLASFSNNKEVVKLLLDKGVNLEIQDNQGSTALMEALKYGYMDIVKLLLDANANIDNQDFDGNTALIEAVGYVGTDFVSIKKIKFLLDAGTEINIKNNNNRTALDIAESRLIYDDYDYRDLAVIELLRNEPIRRKELAQKKVVEHLPDVLTRLVVEYVV